jgi:hypothetical protein
MGLPQLRDVTAIFRSDTLLVDLFLEAHQRAPRQIIIDLDATDSGGEVA